MMILVAGMPRTGSTWLYNVVRFAYLNTGRTVYGGGVDDYDPGLKADVHIVKLHDFRQDLLERAQCVLTTIRDLRDVAASMVRKGWVRDDPQELTEYLRAAIETQYRPWAAYSALEVSYRMVVQCPEAAIAAVLQEIRVFTDPCEIAADVDKLTRIVRPDMDQASMIWPGHITDGGIGTYRNTLSKESARAVQTLAREVRWGA